MNILKRIITLMIILPTIVLLFGCNQDDTTSNTNSISDGEFGKGISKLYTCSLSAYLSGLDSNRPKPYIEKSLIMHATAKQMTTLRVCKNKKIVDYVSCQHTERIKNNMIIEFAKQGDKSTGRFISTLYTDCPKSFSYNDIEINKCKDNESDFRSLYIDPLVKYEEDRLLSQAKLFDSKVSTLARRHFAQNCSY